MHSSMQELWHGLGQPEEEVSLDLDADIHPGWWHRRVNRIKRKFDEVGYLM
jgi:hypothetical protein